MTGPVRVGVLGPLAAWDASDTPVALKGPRQRALLARLLVARGRAVPLAVLAEDIFPDPPARPAGAIRTFVADLRRALEPDRPARARPAVLVTVGTGYAIELPAERCDATRFDQAVRRARELPADASVEALDEALGWWRGPAYADFAEAPWAAGERSRLTELRLQAVELAAAARLRLGRAGEVVGELDAHLIEHPWREEAWALLATALRDTGRQAEALAVLRRARTMLADQLGLDPGPALRRLETDILRQADPPPADPTEQIWVRAAASHRDLGAAGARTRLRSAVDLLRSLAVTGGEGLVSSRAQRLDTIRAAEALGDPELTARVIGGYDVPAIWSRADDEAQAREVVAAADRTLARLPDGAPATLRARLLATIAVESRGHGDPRAANAAAEAVRLARAADDPAVLAFALNGAFMQSFGRTGLAGRRDAIGAELVELATRRGLTPYALLGHLVRMQARAGLADLAGADGHAAAADTLAESYESPNVAVFTTWYRAVRLAVTGAPAATVADRYRAAGRLLDDAGMPGMRRGLLPLALLTVRRAAGRPAPVGRDVDWGPYLPWVRPLVLLAAGRTGAAGDALRAVPDPPYDHLTEALWCLVGDAAVQLGERTVAARAHAALRPAVGELAGAGSGVLTLGPVTDHLARLSALLER